MDQAEGLQKEEASGISESLCSRYHIKAKRLGKPDWQTMDGDFKWWSGRGSSMASETLLPTEPPMCPLCSGLHIRWLNLLSGHGLNRAKGEQNGLRAEQMEPSSPDLRALPISPKHWARRHRLLGYRLLGC